MPTVGRKLADSIYLRNPLVLEEHLLSALLLINQLFVFCEGVAASQDQDFGTANLHVEVSDVVSVLVYVGVAKGNGVLSKTGEAYERLFRHQLEVGLTKHEINERAQAAGLCPVPEVTETGC